jgi:hypothetical protein
VGERRRVSDLGECVAPVRHLDECTGPQGPVDLDPGAGPDEVRTRRKPPVTAYDLDQIHGREHAESRAGAAYVIHRLVDTRTQLRWVAGLQA